MQTPSLPLRSALAALVAAALGCANPAPEPSSVEGPVFVDVDPLGDVARRGEAVTVSEVPDCGPWSSSPDDGWCSWTNLVSGRADTAPAFDLTVRDTPSLATQAGQSFRARGIGWPAAIHLQLRKDSVSTDTGDFTVSVRAFGRSFGRGTLLARGSIPLESIPSDWTSVRIPLTLMAANGRVSQSEPAGYAWTAEVTRGGYGAVHVGALSELAQPYRYGNAFVGVQRRRSRVSWATSPTDLQFALVTDGRPLPSCSNGTADGDEADVDCGEACAAPCGKGLRCRTGSDCASGFECSGGVCAVEPCANGRMDGTEADVDCGGRCVDGESGGCGAGMLCRLDRDCESHNCLAGVCAALDRDAALGAAPADGGPTGVDEGAACAAEGAVQTRDIGLPPCVKTLAAGGFAGCTSGTQGCGAACGGLYLPPCRTAALCQTASDCDSGRCRRVSGSKPVVYRCAVATCSDGAKSTREAAKDCGEACDVNGDEKRCSGATPTSKVVCRTHLDCPVSNFCVNGLCAATPPVYDGIQNGSETAIDCGGGVAPACASGLPCGAHADCAAGYCDPVNRVCGSGTCSDQLRDGDETAVDCGGTCARDQARRCAVAAACLFASDCTSGVCTKGKCAPSTGKDGVRNGDESDVDCGGAGLTKCAVGKGCSRDDQCLTGVCRAGSGTCVAPSAFDGIRNGTETGIDCGGRSAPPCAVDVACGTATDCLSGNCDRTTKTCKACTGGTCQVGAECALNADCQSKFCRTVSGAAKGVCEDATCLKAGACGGKCAVPCDQTSEGTCPADQVYKASGVVRCHLYDDRAAGTAAPLATSCASGKLWPAATLPAVGRAGYCVVTCKVHADCASGRCAKTGACEPTTAASVEWCEDGVQDGLETAVDCGSACGVACAVGAGCRSDADCSDPTTSGVCVRGRCAAASCFDGLPGRGEADVDCGGTCADANGVPVRCEAGRRCTIGADCASGRCENGTCARESLQNYLRDGDESDIDCGGTSGRRCAEGRTCRVKGDCRYGAACVRGLCACPEGETCRDSDPNPAATAGPAAELARACRAVGQVCPLSGGGSGRCAAVGDGACRPVANLDEDRRCLTSADCLASFDPCEAPRGRCVAGVCRFSKVPEGTPCDDGDECTAADQTTCTAAGACVQVSGGTPVTHEEPAACASDASGGRLYGVCLRTNGSGVDVPAAKGETGASCRPGCWVGDALKAPGDESLGKVCRPELAATGWSLSSAACSSENASGQSPSALEADCRLDGYWDWRADASGGNQAVCVQAFAPAGTPCSRTGGGRCTAGAAPTCEAFCTIEDVVAQPKNAYFRGESNRENSCEECRPATSDKAWSAKAAGTTCDDGEASTYADRCVVSGAAAACSGTASSRDCPNELVPGTCLTQAHDGKGGCTPNGAVALPGAVCRAETEGGCDAAERCTGTAACPPDVVKAAGETCRAEAGACDAKEVCDGVNRTCPFDDYKLPGEASGTGVSCSGLGPGTDTASWRFFEASTSRLYLYKSTTGRPDIPETGALIKSAGDSIAVNWPMKNVSTGATMAALPNQDVFLAEVAQQGLPVPLWRRPDPAGKYPNAPFQFGARHRLGRDSSGNYLTPDWRAYGMVRYAEVVEIDHSLVNSAYPALLTGGSDIPNNWAFNVSGPTARSEQLQASGLGEGEAAPMEKLRLVYQSEPFERRFDLWSAFPV
ncbi:MAG: hypothetical protein RL199_614, partial [Pseudomonadota bacterium]